MNGFLEALRVQRWDDHRYYHHSRINQSLHLLSAISFRYYESFFLRLKAGSGTASKAGPESATLRTENK